MKKVYVLLVAVFAFSFLANSQQAERRLNSNFKSSVKHVKSNSKAKEIIFQEDFEGVDVGQMPDGWFVFDVDKQTPANQGSINPKCQQWNVQALGQAPNIFKMPVVTAYFDPVGTSDDWMFTKKIDIPNVEADEFILLKFKEYSLAQAQKYWNSYEVRIMEEEPTEDNISTSTVIAPLKVAEFNVDITIDLTAYANKSIYIAWRDHSVDKSLLAIDDIKVIKTPKETKLEMIGAEISSFSILPQNSNIDVIAGVKNVGTEDINTFTVVCAVNGVDLAEQKITLTEPMKADGKNIFNLDPKPTLTNVGENTIEVKVTKVNDADLADPLKAEIIKVTAYEVDANMPNMKLLSETFTSSTCGPCAKWNPMLDSWIEQQKGNVNYIKYQVWWPNAGDPYTIDACKQRLVEYYKPAQLGVPTQYLQGVNTPVVGPPTIDKLSEMTNALTALKSCISIASEPEFEGKKITVPVTVNSAITTSDFVLQVAICEKKTTKNVGTNRETEFHNVLMAMVPNANGTNLDLTKGEKFEEVLEIDMTGTHVEEMSDLVAVIFVQDSKTQQVLNSETFEITGEAIAVTDVSLSETTKELKVGETFTLTATIEPNNAENKNITWSSSDDNIAKVDANGLVTAVSEGTATITVTTEDGGNTATCDVTVKAGSGTGINDNKANNIKIYPTLVENGFVVETSNILALDIYSPTGKKVKTVKLTNSKQFINVSDLQSGMYMVKVGNEVIKFVKK